MSECKNCGLHGCDPMQDRLYAHLKTDNAELRDRAESAEAKLAAVQFAVEEIEVAYWDGDVSMLHYIEKALKALDGGETK